MPSYQYQPVSSEEDFLPPPPQYTSSPNPHPSSSRDSSLPSSYYSGIATSTTPSDFLVNDRREEQFTKPPTSSPYSSQGGSATTQEGTEIDLEAQSLTTREGDDGETHPRQCAHCHGSGLEGKEDSEEREHTRKKWEKIEMYGVLGFCFWFGGIIGWVIVRSV